MARHDLDTGIQFHCAVWLARYWTKGSTRVEQCGWARCVWAMHLAGPTHSLMQLQKHTVTAYKSHICRLESDVVVAVQVHINFIWLLLESPSHACSASGCLLTSTNRCSARLVVGRILNVSLFMTYVPILDLISDPLLPDIFTELMLVASYSLVYWILGAVLWCMIPCTCFSLRGCRSLFIVNRCNASSFGLLLSVV